MWTATGLSWAFTGCSPKCLDPGGLHVLDALLEALSTSDHSSAAAEPAPMTVPWAGPLHKASVSLSTVATAASALSAYSCFLLCPTLSQL